MKGLAGIISIFLFIPYLTQSQDFNQRVYSCYVKGDMDSWEKLLRDNYSINKSAKDQYDIAMASYGFIGYCLGNEQKKRARPYLDKVEVISADLLHDDPMNARYNALRGALYGYRLIYQPQKSVSLGPKALKKVKLAIESDPQCAQAWVESANSDWVMPEIFGGSKINAIAGYEKAIRIMEKDPTNIRDNWYYLNINMILAGWYEERNHTFAAHELYRKVLLIEPAFVRASEKLKK